MERVNKGERYWYIGADKYIPILSYDMRTIFEDDRYRSGNYFTDYSEAEAMAKKLRAVLKGAEVIEMPSEEEMLNSLPSDWSFEQYMSGAGIGWHKCYEWLKSKIVK